VCAQSVAESHDSYIPFRSHWDIAIVRLSHTLGTTLGRIGGKALLGA
jgi:hypothetical protein